MFNFEVNFMRELFYNNGYPVCFFNKVLDTFTNKQVSSEPDINDTQVECVVLKLPFIGEASYTLSKKLKRIIGDYLNMNVRVVFTSCKVSSYFSLKCKTPLPLISNVVYEFSCSSDAGLTYIGKTKRNLITRVGEHLSSREKSHKSEVKSHIPKCHSCRSADLNLDSFKVIKRAKSSFDVLIHEALLIKRKSPKLNKQLYQKGSIYTLKVF